MTVTSTIVQNDYRELDVRGSIQQTNRNGWENTGSKDRIERNEKD